jgi:tetratricopeptide (TPR) repeat protein
VSFREYLQLYDQNLEELEQNSEGLIEYEDRRLSTTWSISVKQVESHDAKVVQLLRLLAYFNNQDIWYELLRPGGECGLPWLPKLVESKMKFSGAMAKLHDYSLVDVQSGSYSIHACAHDWISSFLNRDLCADLYSAAVHCVGSNTVGESEPDSWVANRRLLQHANRLGSNPLKRLMISRMPDIQGWCQMGYLHEQLGNTIEAEHIYLRMLENCERVWGREHELTVSINFCLGNTYFSQGRAAEAEQMYLLALVGYIKVHGQEHILTLKTLNNLGNIYSKQGKITEAEQVYQRALTGYEKAYGPKHVITLSTVNNLGRSYLDQGKIADAEQTLLRTLAGYENTRVQDHPYKLITIINLGLVYSKQGKTAEAAQMFLRALAGYERVFGPEHEYTQQTAAELNNLCKTQGEVCQPVTSPSSTKDTAATVACKDRYEGTT